MWHDTSPRESFLSASQKGGCISQFIYFFTARSWISLIQLFLRGFLRTFQVLPDMHWFTYERMIYICVITVSNSHSNTPYTMMTWPSTLHAHRGQVTGVSRASQMKKSMSSLFFLCLSWLRLGPRHYFRYIYHVYVRVLTKKKLLFWYVTVVLDLLSTYSTTLLRHLK